MNRHWEGSHCSRRSIDFLPFSSTLDDLILSQLELAINQTNDGGEVIGAILFQFTTQNYSKSKQQCEEQRTVIHKKCQEASMNSQPLDIDMMHEIDEQYHRHSSCCTSSCW